MVVKTVRRDTAGHGMESLTPYQANRARVEVRMVRRDTAEPAMDNSQSIEPTGPEWE